MPRDEIWCMQIQHTIQNHLHSFVQNLGENASKDEFPEKVRAEIIAAAIAIARGKEDINKDNLEVLYDVERTFIRCSKLLKLLWTARKNGEITETIFLNLEIQINDQLTRLMNTCSKMKVGTILEN
jgi:hypothetical protein